MGLTRRTIRRTGCRVGLVGKGCVGGPRPRPRPLPSSRGWGVQSSSGRASMRWRKGWVLANGDGEADLPVTAEGNDAVGVESRCRPVR